MTNPTTRRDVLHQLAFATAGLSLFSLASCNDKNDSSVAKIELKKLSPFYLPPAEPLQAGPGGIDIRTWVRSSQTNMQFSCVETAVRPKQMGPAPVSYTHLQYLYTKTARHLFLKSAFHVTVLKLPKI